MDLMEFKILNTAIERILNKKMAELGITYTQATVIGYLQKNMGKEVCQKDVEHNLGLTHPTVSSILGRLEDKEFIITEPSSFDRRFKKIILTKKSLEMAETIQNKIDIISKEVFRNFSEEEKELLSKMVQRIIFNIN